MEQQLGCYGIKGQGDVISHLPDGGVAEDGPGDVREAAGSCTHCCQIWQSAQPLWKAG